MPNTHVFTGLDGPSRVAVEIGVEGDAAKAVNDTYVLTPDRPGHRASACETPR